MEIVEEFNALYRAGVVEWEHVNRAIVAYYLALGERRPVRRPLQERFNLQLIGDVEVIQQFRFHRNDLPFLQQCLEVITYPFYTLFINVKRNRREIRKFPTEDF